MVAVLLQVLLLQVVERLSEEHAKKKHLPSKREVEREISQEHDMLAIEKDTLEAARKQVERAKMEQVGAPTSNLVV